MFYHIWVDFSVTVGKATVALSAAASTLNITGQWILMVPRRRLK